MASFDIELVGKIGSMALIRKEDNDIDYNVFSRLGRDLKPGMIWVSSGAAVIGRLDYMKRNGKGLDADADTVKADYSAQGQAVLMQNYRNFISHEYSVRQLLVEHQHFNDAEKREHIRKFLLRCPSQNAIPIINYNDPVNFEENRKWELANFRNSEQDVVECVDNDETASVIAALVNARTLVILTSTFGIYRDADDPSTLINEISGKDTDELIDNIRQAQEYCVGSSRQGAAGARAKLGYIIEPIKNGTTVIIGYGGYSLSDVINGNVKRTVIGVR